MKIALFTEIYDCGGIDTFIINLINHWPSKNDSFVIIANKNYPGLKVIEDKLTRDCSVIRHEVPLYSNLFSGRSYPKLVRIFFTLSIRYLYLLYGILAFNKLIRKTKSDMLMVINGGYPGGDSCRAAAIAWKLIKDKPKSIHNFHNIVQKTPWYLFLQEYVIDWLVSRCTSCFITVSQAAAESMSARSVISKKKITSYIYNGLEITPDITVSKKNIREEIGISSITPLCLMLATYEARKGHFFLCKAFKKVLQEVPDTHLLICGYGFPHEIEQVEKYIKDFQLQERVHLMGFRRDISHLLSNVDILLVASQTNESFGYTSVEAMAHKVPVVATHVGGVPEVVANNEGGYCVDANDVHSYANLIVELLINNDLRKEQGEKGFRRFQAFFTAQVMSCKYAELIHKFSGIAVNIKSRLDGKC